MLSLSDANQAEFIEAFNSTSRNLDDLLKIDNKFFDSMVNQIYPSELQLNKTNVCLCWFRGKNRLDVFLCVT